MSEVRSAHVWERGRKIPSSLTVTLQEARVQKKHLTFAMICEGREEEKNPQYAAGYLCESMVGWFYNKLLPYCSKIPEDAAFDLQVLLKGQWDRAWKEWQGYAGKHDMEVGVKICGILFCGSSYVAWGNLPVHVLNRRFNKPRRKNILPVGKEISFVFGEISGFLSFLLENTGMKEGIREEEVLESLYTEYMMEEERLQKRLDELGMEAIARNGGKCVGAVVLEVEP